ncbi:restriction endonuclease subunit S [Brevibacterium aurantiacum]|nr:restriction endonuclease subunit S [Brevibacterium aurantiacum]
MSEVRELNFETFQRWTRRLVPEEGDLLVAREAPVGPVVRVPAGDVWAAGQRTTHLRANSELINPRYFYYLLISPIVQRRLLSRAMGSTVEHLRVGDVRDFVLPTLPNRASQDAIAEVLGALDDKIAANERLSSGAQSLLQEHFAMLGLDRFADTGPFLTVNDLFEVNPRTSRKVTGQSPYLGMKDLPDTSMTVSSWSTREAKSGARFVNGDVLLARITPCLENGKAGYVDFLENAEIGIGSTEFIVVRARDPLLSVVPFFLTKSERFRDFAIRHMQGTSGRQRLAASDVAGYQLAEVEDERLNRFGELSISLLERVRTAVAESQGLAHTRDELLPLLMSGKITVKDAENVVSDAV